MKHYGIWVNQTHRKIDGDGKEIVKYQSGGWMVGPNNIVFCTTSKAHVKRRRISTNGNIHPLK